MSTKPSFMSKLPYMLVYLGVAAAFGLGIYVIYNKYQEAEARKIQEEQQKELALRKEKEEEAARKLQADIERQLAVQKKKEEAYNKAVKYAQENPDKPKQIRQYYLETKEFVKGTEFEGMIDQRIAEVEDAPRGAAAAPVVKQLDPESERLMKQLDFRSRPYIDSKKYMEAVAIYRDYNGPLKGKTMAARQEIIDKLYKKGIEYEQELDTAEKKLQKQLGPVGDYIIADKMPMALKTMEEFLKDKELDPVKDKIEVAIQILKSLSNANSMLEDSLRNDINKTVSLETWSGKITIEIKAVKDAKIFFLTKMGTTKVKESIPFSKLNSAELIKRLNYMSTAGKYLFAGLCAYKHKKVDEAKGYFEKSGIFSQAVLEAIGKIELKKLKQRLG